MTKLKSKNKEKVDETNTRHKNGELMARNIIEENVTDEVSSFGQDEKTVAENLLQNFVIDTLTNHFNMTEALP